MPDLSFGSNNTLPVYLYENFSYVISNPVVPSAVQTPITKTSGLSAGLFSDTSSNFTFAGSGSSLTAGSTESFTYVVRDDLGNPPYTSTNTVTVGVGRFTDLSGNGVSGNAYTFYKNEPISRVRLMAPFPLSTSISSVPSLPPGLRFFVSGSNVDISGSPLTTLPTSNYLLIGKDAATGSKIVTTSNTFTVSNERILYDLSGSPIVNMTVGTPISSRVLTAAFPPYSSVGELRYVWNSFPDGLNVYDVSGTNKTSSNNFGFTTTDASHVFAIAGTPTEAAARSFATAGVSSNTYIIQGTRTSPLPAIVSNFPITFAFNETVLFDQPSPLTLYSSVPLDPSANFFRAATYFASGVGTAISNIFSPNLRTDLSLTFVPAQSRAYLTGTPSLGPSNADYTIRAINSNGITRDLSATINVSNDSVTFVSPTPTDLSFSFILSRPLNLPKPGYYQYPIQFKAQAASGLPVTLSAPALAGSGLSLDSNGFLVGFPNAVVSSRQLRVMATTSTVLDMSSNYTYEVLDDTFTFGAVPLISFIQNKAITPITIPVTTLSERPIIGYSDFGLPAGLDVSPAGVIRGTPLSSDVSGTFQIIPTTGYTSGSGSYDYTLTPDTIAFLPDANSYSYVSGDSVAITIPGAAYSGATVSNYDLSMSSTFGLSIGSTSGFLTGTWTDFPPLPASCNFYVTAQAGTLKGVLPATLTTSNTIFRDVFVIVQQASSSYLISAHNPFSNWSPMQVNDYSSMFGDLQTKDSNFIFMPASDGRIYKYTSSSQSPTIVSLTDAPLTYLPRVSSITNKTGTSTWWAIGHRFFTETETRESVLYTTSNDGETWGAIADTVEISGFRCRDSNIITNKALNGYVTGGAALKYKNGVLLAGGLDGVSRSTDDGVSWTSGGGPLREIAYFSLDHSNTWVSTGSVRYTTFDSNVAYTHPPSKTIQYSTDQGETWIPAVSGDFNMLGYEVAYGSNRWLAAGLSYDTGSLMYNWELRYSDDGMNWSNVTELNDLFDPMASRPSWPSPLGSFFFDGINWNVFANVFTGVSNQSRLYTTTTFPSNWTYTTIPPQSFRFPLISTTRFTNATPPIYFRSGPAPVQINIAFETSTGTGPIFTFQTTSYLLYQYIPVTPIQLSATGTGQVYFFVTTNDLPIGLSFNPLTNEITGTPAEIGQTHVTIYARDDLGTRALVLSFNVVIPRLIRKQDGAGAYTSLLRQYTQVLGAQNARDNRVLPSQERALGEFMSPEAPDVVTAVIDPKCKNLC